MPSVLPPTSPRLRTAAEISASVEAVLRKTAVGIAWA
jgi:hypothetical protein